MPDILRVLYVDDDPSLLDIGKVFLEDSGEFTKVLVFLANVEEATSRDIEQGTDLRQPEVSIAMNYMFEHGWLKNRESKAMSKGRPVKIYTLAVPVPEIMTSIEKQKKTEANNQLALIKKMRDYI